MPVEKKSLFRVRCDHPACEFVLRVKGNEWFPSDRVREIAPSKDWMVDNGYYYCPHHWAVCSVCGDKTAHVRAKQVDDTWQCVYIKPENVEAHINALDLYIAPGGTS
jgi:hypothetical protein